MTDRAPSTAPAPTLVARGVRVEVDGAPALTSLDLATRGDRVLLVGSAGPLLTAIAGVRPRGDTPLADPLHASITAGELEILGRDVRSGAHHAVCGVALHDPALPLRWTVVEYLLSCARLDGASRRAAKLLAGGVLETLSLTALARTRLRAMSTLERRVVVLAGAVVSQPAAVLVDNPLERLDAREASLMLGALGRALYGRAALVSVPRVKLTDATGELARTATDICLFRGGALVLHDGAAELLSKGRLYELTVTANGDALAAALEEQGLTLRGGPYHHSIVLPEDLGPSIVLAAAARARAPVTSCMPVVG